VFFGREIIEVATFRAATAPSPGEEPLAEADAAAGEGSLTEVDAAVAEDSLLQADGAEGDESDDDVGEDDDPEDDEVDDAEAEDDEALTRTDVLASEHLLSDPEVPSDHTVELEVLPGSGAEDEDDDLGDDAGHPQPVVAPRSARQYQQRIAHGDESAADIDVDPNAERMFDETGRIIRDNVYGTIDADVWRRDFTCNALYYNIADFSIWDYVGGFEDVAARKLKLIGDPETRFREDPVRMLRGARFEAKLGFEIDPATSEPIPRLKALMGGVPPARLFDETLKLFLTGHGRKSFEVLRRRGLLSVLLPTVDNYFNKHPGSLVEQLVMRGLENTDARVMADKPVTPTFLFALLLYGPIAAIIEATPPERWHELSTILDACDRAARQVQTHISLPKRFSLGMREMFALQPRLEHPRGRRALRVLEHPRFRAAYDLLLLRAEFGMAPDEITQWWTTVQEVSSEERARMADSLTGQAPRSESAPRRGGRRRRRRRGPTNPS
jgi:poly(A) polymerase